MGRVVFINRYFHPDHAATSQLLGDLAFDLAAGGRDVAVICGRQLYDDPDARLPARETISGVAVHRVWTSRFGRKRLAGRAIDYLSFYPTAVLVLLRIVRRGDVVVAKTDPPLVAVVAGAVARWRGARLVNWLQDLFPDVAEALGIGLARGPIGRLLKGFRDRSLKSAAVNVVLGTVMAERARALGAPAGTIRIIHNWADGGAIRPLPVESSALRRRWGMEGRFVVGYAGNLGRAHDVATVISAARALHDLDDLAWLVVGGGAGRAALEREVSMAGLTGFVFRPYQPREDLADVLAAADVHWVTLRPELEGLIVPSKVYGVMAAGRPILFIGAAEGEVARLIRSHQCGAIVPPGDGAAMAAAIRTLKADRDRCRLLGENARKAFDTFFDRPRALDQWRGVIDAQAARP